MRKFIAAGLLLLSIPFIQGCAIGVLAAGVGYAVGQGRKGTAQQMEAKARLTEQYNNYKLGMERINLDREKANLKPQPIEEFDVWLDKQPLTPEEVKLFQKMKAQTASDIKVQQEAQGKIVTTKEKTEPKKNFGP